MDNKPQIPTLKQSQSKQPQLKIKGLAGSVSLIDRLKQFKKKDLAFILAGLGVLFMAPLAEHFMMSPENGDGKLGAGFSSRGGTPFGNGSSPYEGTGLAPGGVIGGGGDVITPLNVRDPSALVMGPGATQQPPAAGGAPSVSAPSAPVDNKWNDAIAAGRAAAGAATKKASLPMPKVPLSAGGLRGLGAAAGGSGAAASLAPISASNVPNTAAGQNSLSNVRGGGNIKGVARGPGQGGAAGAMENLKKAAGEAGRDFNRAGSAASALESAASRDMGSGAEGSGAGQGPGKEDKAAAQSQDKGSKSTGESLDFLDQKAEREKARDLKWKLAEKQATLWPDLKQKMLETSVMDGFMKPLTKGVAGLVDSAGGDLSKADVFDCNQKRGIKKSVVGNCGDDPEKNKGFGMFTDGGGNIFYNANCQLPAPLTNCSLRSDADGGKSNATAGVSGTQGLPEGETSSGSFQQAGATLEPICKSIDARLSKIDEAAASRAKAEGVDASEVATLRSYAAAARSISSASGALSGGAGTLISCGGSSAAAIPGANGTGEQDKNLMRKLKDSKTLLTGNEKAALTKLSNSVSKVVGDANGIFHPKGLTDQNAAIATAIDNYEKGVVELEGAASDPVQTAAATAKVASLKTALTAEIEKINGPELLKKPELQKALDEAAADHDVAAPVQDLRAKLDGIKEPLNEAGLKLSGEAKSSLDAGLASAAQVKDEKLKAQLASVGQNILAQLQATGGLHAASAKAYEEQRKALDSIDSRLQGATKAFYDLGKDRIQGKAEDQVNGHYLKSAEIPGFATSGEIGTAKTAFTARKDAVQATVANTATEGGALKDGEIEPLIKSIDETAAALTTIK